MEILRFGLWIVFTWLFYRWQAPTDPSFGHSVLWLIGSGIASAMTIGLTAFIAALPVLIFSRDSEGFMTQVFLPVSLVLFVSAVAVGLYMLGNQA